MMFTTAEGFTCVGIDRLAVLPDYRRKGLARRVIQEILSDAQMISNNSVSAITLSIPEKSWVKQKLETIGWIPFANKPREIRGLQQYITMIYYASKISTS